MVHLLQFTLTLYFVKSLWGARIIFNVNKPHVLHNVGSWEAMVWRIHPKITLFFIKGQNFLLCLRLREYLNLDDFQLCPLLVDDWDYSELIFLGNQGRIQMVPSITVDCQLELIDPTIINLQPKDDWLVINSQINRSSIWIQKSADILQHHGCYSPWIFVLEHFELMLSIFNDF